MEVPPPQGFEPGKLIGYGGCGKVYQVAGGTADGARVIKIFDDAAISRRLLTKMTERLRIGGWPGGVMPVIAAHFEAKRAFWVTPLVAGVEEGVDPLPSTLQTWLAEHPGTYSLKLVRLLSDALARMHERRVPHGNLKPGNVFFADGGGVLLSDWAMGNLPGAERFTFTDAVLYQAPEQLRNTAGYLDEEGYRWDVFSFGVLAYRILTGRFPRCHETFALVAPAAGETRREGVQADLGKLARNLEDQPAVSWPDESQNPLEAGFRDWIDRCLQLDPAKRPFTMVEVAAGFTALENQGIFEAEREALMDQRRAAERRAWRNWYFAGGVAAGAVLLGALWQMANRQLLDERSARQQDVSTITAANDTAVATQADAARKTAVLLQALHDDRDSALARLETARLIGDQLFSAAMEKANRVLPPLDGRDLRLKRLERYFADFLTKSEAAGGPAEERARVRLQLAEISLAAGDAPAAALRIAEATRAWEDLPMDGALKFRLAGMTLHLALLQQSAADPETDFSFMAARKALGEVPQTEVDADRLNRLLAILDFHESQLLAAQGDETEALAQLMRASQTLNGIADRRPDAAILRSELAACYLSSATLLEAMGSPVDARDVRAQAAAEIAKLLKETPGDFGLRLELAGCLGAMAESAMLAGDVGAAQLNSREALKLLGALVDEQPENVEAVSRMASQLGLRAGIQRDRGQSAEAIADYAEGIRLLEGLRASAPENVMVGYRLALLWWQKGRMSGMAGQRDEEIALIRQAGELFSQLETRPAPDGLRLAQLQSSRAYLLGDLGHALQLAGRKDEAQRAFSDAVDVWERLLKSKPRSEEYRESLDWCRQRLADL